MRQKKILPDYLKHAKENNKKLQEELERLMLTYIFDETYEAAVRSFTSDISSVETAVLPTLENFDNQVKPFSELEKIFEKSLNTLSAVENGQVEVLKIFEISRKMKLRRVMSLMFILINCMLSSVTWKNVIFQVFLNPS